MKGRVLFDVTKPGEYGTKHPSGFIMVTHEKLNGQRVFISSRNFRETLSKYFHIDESQIASFTDVKEEFMDGKKGLAVFKARLANLQNNRDVLIHCVQGRNRSPVAAVIYLISRGLTAVEAVDAVVNAFRSQRNSNFKLNFCGHYTAVLQEAYCLQENSLVQTNLETRRPRHTYALRSIN